MTEVLTRVKTKGVLFPLAALVIGVASAYVAVLYTSVVFWLVPVWAFVFGFFSNSRIGSASAFLLVVSHTATISMMLRGTFEPVDHVFGMLGGGLVLCIIAYGAPLVRKRPRGFRSAVVIALLAVSLAWYGLISWPRGTYYYQVIIESPEQLGRIELFLPLVEVSGEPYAEIFNHPYEELSFVTESDLTEDYSLELVETEYGLMVRLSIPELKRRNVPGTVTTAEGGPTVPGEPRPVHTSTPDNLPYPFAGNVIFKMSRSGGDRLQFSPKREVEAQRVMVFERHWGGIRVETREILEEFEVPVKVNSGGEVNVRIRLETSSSRGRGVNIAIGTGETYREAFQFRAVDTNEWALVSGEAISTSRLTGPD